METDTLAGMSRASMPTDSPVPDASDAVIRLRGVNKTYYKPNGDILVEALKSIDLNFRRGEYVAIMGASGSGKSTLMNILGCLDRPTKGEFILAEKNVASLDDDELSHVRGQLIGFVFQAFNLIPALTIAQNVAVPLFYQQISPVERTRRAAELLDAVGLGDRLNHRPSELSGGQQQRAAIARALVNDPQFVLADEPTGNLDSTTGKAILSLFDRLHQEKGLTIVMVTHDDSIAERCERIVRLRDGLVESDTVFRRTGILAATAQPAAALQ